MPKTETEALCITCTACGNSYWILVREASDLTRPELQKSFKLTRCSSCGHIIQNPPPDEQELNAAYSISESYVAYRAAWKETGRPLWKILRVWTMKRRMSCVKRYMPGRQVLDVGCGAGDFMVEAHRAGWSVKAVEYDRSMVEMIVKHLGFDVRVGELAQGIWNENEFDLVTFWNVVEHLPDPLRDLQIASAYLRPGGAVIANLPTNFAAERGLWFRQYWAILDLPRHLNFFSEAALSQMFAKAGFDIVSYKTPFVQSAWCYYMSSWFWANRDKRKGLRWLRFLALASAVTLVLPAVAIAALRRRGIEATIVAVKR